MFAPLPPLSPLFRGGAVLRASPLRPRVPGGPAACWLPAVPPAHAGQPGVCTEGLDAKGSRVLTRGRAGLPLRCGPPTLILLSKRTVDSSCPPGAVLIEARRGEHEAGTLGRAGRGLGLRTPSSVPLPSSAEAQASHLLPSGLAVCPAASSSPDHPPASWF